MCPSSRFDSLRPGKTPSALGGPSFVPHRCCASRSTSQYVPRGDAHGFGDLGEVLQLSDRGVTSPVQVLEDEHHRSRLTCALSELESAVNRA